MAIKHKAISIFGLILSTIFAGLIFSAPTHAEGHKQYLQISPAKKEIELSAGQTYKGSVRVQNIGEEKLTYSMSAAPFTPIDENYSFDFDHVTDATRLSEYVTFNKTEGSLEPHTDETIDFTVNVPKDLPGGGQYMAILATNTQDSNDQKNAANIKTIGRVASLFYAKVDGDINECGKINSSSLSTFYFAPPVKAETTVENCGNIHLSAKYTLKVYPLFSDEEIFTNEERDEETALVIPGTTRYHATSWGEDRGAPAFGIFTGEYTVEFAGNTETTGRKLILIIPLWLIIVFIALIGAIIFWLVSRAQKRKQSKKETI